MSGRERTGERYPRSRSRSRGKYSHPNRSYERRRSRSRSRNRDRHRDRDRHRNRDRDDRRDSYRDGRRDKSRDHFRHRDNRKRSRSRSRSRHRRRHRSHSRSRSRSPHSHSRRHRSPSKKDGPTRDTSHQGRDNKRRSREQDLPSTSQASQPEPKPDSPKRTKLQDDAPVQPSPVQQVAPDPSVGAHASGSLDEKPVAPQPDGPSAAHVDGKQKVDPVPVHTDEGSHPASSQNNNNNNSEPSAVPLPPTNSTSPNAGVKVEDRKEGPKNDRAASMKEDAEAVEAVPPVAKVGDKTVGGGAEEMKASPPPAPPLPADSDPPFDPTTQPVPPIQNPEAVHGKVLDVNGIFHIAVNNRIVHSIPFADKSLPASAPVNVPAHMAAVKYSHQEFLPSGQIVNATGDTVDPDEVEDPETIRKREELKQVISAWSQSFSKPQSQLLTGTPAKLPFPPLLDIQDTGDLMKVCEQLQFKVTATFEQARDNLSKYYKGTPCPNGFDRHPEIPEFCIKYTSSRHCVACLAKLTSWFHPFIELRFPPSVHNSAYGYYPNKEKPKDMAGSTAHDMFFEARREYAERVNPLAAKEDVDAVLERWWQVCTDEERRYFNELERVVLEHRAQAPAP